MPLGKYESFASCHAAKMREGMSSAAADRYCGALEQQIYGSSQKQNYALDSQQEMSQEEIQDQAAIPVPQQALEEITAAVVNTLDAIQEGEVTEDEVALLEKAKEDLAEVVNIEPM